jgi:cobalamin biosynthesis protein CobT
VNAIEFDTLVGPSNVLGDNTEVEDQDNIEGENNDETENESHDESENDESEDGDHDSTDVEDEDKNVNEEDIDDEEHIVEEVDVKMNGFRFEVEGEAEETMHPKLNLARILQVFQGFSALEPFHV